jgi:hypothetical protein
MPAPQLPRALHYGRDAHSKSLGVRLPWRRCQQAVLEQPPDACVSGGGDGGGRATRQPDKQPELQPVSFLQLFR